MQSFEFAELERLAELYRDAKTTNPCLVLALGGKLNTEDEVLLHFIIDNSEDSKVSAWRVEAEREKNKTDGRDGGRALSKEEYASMAKRDADQAKSNAVLSFMIKEKKSGQSNAS
jgi:hypothetical protein